MKDCLKICTMTVASLGVALIIYPMTHELGHVLATLVCGGKVSEFSLFPLPNILSDVSGVSKTGLVFIGLSGVILPVFISAVIHPRGFIAWYCSFVYKAIVLISLVISVFVIIMSKSGFIDQNDDMIKVIGYWSSGTTILLILLAITAVVMIVFFAKEHPIKRICKSFGI